MRWQDALWRAVYENALFRNVALPALAQRKVHRWKAAGGQGPAPHAVKVRNLLSIAALYRTDILVETGTYYGDMVAAALGWFDEIYSIEIFEELAVRAAQRFRNEPVSIIHGDSSKALSALLPTLNGRVLFWLDGHYSGPGTGRGDRDTPVIGELEAIATLRAGAQDAILVDDMRLFGSEPAYPDLAEFCSVWSVRLGKKVRLADDAIFFLPP